MMMSGMAPWVGLGTRMWDHYVNVVAALPQYIYIYLYIYIHKQEER